MGSRHRVIYWLVFLSRALRGRERVGKGNGKRGEKGLDDIDVVSFILHGFVSFSLYSSHLEKIHSIPTVRHQGRAEVLVFPLLYNPQSQDQTPLNTKKPQPH